MPKKKQGNIVIWSDSEGVLHESKVSTREYNAWQFANDVLGDKRVGERAVDVAYGKLPTIPEGYTLEERQQAQEVRNSLDQKLEHKSKGARDRNWVIAAVVGGGLITAGVATAGIAPAIIAGVATLGFGGYKAYHGIRHFFAKRRANKKLNTAIQKSALAKKGKKNQKDSPQKKKSKAQSKTRETERTTGVYNAQASKRSQALQAEVKAMRKQFNSRTNPRSLDLQEQRQHAQTAVRPKTTKKGRGR